MKILTRYNRSSANRPSGLLIKIKRLFFVCTIVILGNSSCKKLVEIEPPKTTISGTALFNNNTSAAAAMTGVYYNLMLRSGLASGLGSLGHYCGLAADELQNYLSSTTTSQFYTNSLSSYSDGASNPYFWTELYNNIYLTNAIIEGLTKSTGLTESLKQQLLGEAKFMRAFFHFYTVNLYGKIPLVTTTDYKTNKSIGRTDEEKVYDQIIEDLKDAQDKLGDDFADPIGSPTPERLRPNKGAASALLARVYLYLKDWASSEAQASNVINSSTTYKLEPDLNKVFLAGSTEAIWQLQPINTGYNTYDGNIYVLTSPPGSGQFPATVSEQLTNAFEPHDQRMINWIGVYTSDSITYYSHPYKYKIGPYDDKRPVTEYTMVLRLAEQYLVRAEARAYQEDLTGAQEDLNQIRSRAGLADTTASSSTELVAIIQHERQVELFTEWGHRWFDLKRTEKVDQVMSDITPLKGGVWSPDWAFLPIPLSELKLNPNLKQNAGY